MPVGPRMREALRYVTQHPGCTKHELAIAVGPHNSSGYGYAIVNRAIRAGLIENRSTKDNRSALYPTGGNEEKGQSQ